MNSKNLGFGIFLLIAGIFWALANVGVVDWSVLNSIFTLWPLLLVVIGVSIIFSGKPYVKIAAWVIFAAILIGYGYFDRDRAAEYKAEADNGGTNGGIIVQKLPETENAVLSAKLGGMNIKLGPSDGELLSASASSPYINHDVSYSNDKRKAEITLDQKRVTWDSHNGTYSAGFGLSRDVVWDIKTQLGAVNGTIDMSELKVGSLDLDMGAGNLKIILGSGYENTKVDIDAGASKIDIVLPEDAGARIKADGFLSNTGLEDLNWTKNGDYYVSPNYEEAKSKIEMDIDMGVGALDVKVGGSGPSA